jgi:hypothetical protein
MNAGTIHRAPYNVPGTPSSVNRTHSSFWSQFGTQMVGGARGRSSINVVAHLPGGINVVATPPARRGGQLTGAPNEWPGKGVQVNAIAPGCMITDMPGVRNDPARYSWAHPYGLRRSASEGAVVFLLRRRS